MHTIRGPTPNRTMHSPTRHRSRTESHHEEHDDAHNDQVLHVSLFTELLKTEQGQQNALIVLDKYWWEDEGFKNVVRCFIDMPQNMFEYIVTLLDENMFQHLSSTLLSTFPLSASAFMTCLAGDLITRLYTYYMHLLSPDVPRSLDKCHRSVLLAKPVLNALNDLGLDKVPISPQHPEREEIDGIRFKQPQRKAKHAKRQSRSTFLTDPSPFNAVGAEVPRTMESAEQLAAEILGKQKGILEEYLGVLRIPELASTIENLYVSGTIPVILEVTSARTYPKDAEKATQEYSVTPEIPLAYPQIQPIKAAKYFADPVEGFGPWNLLLASRAIQHLKGFHRSDQAKWAIIKKKFQELSNGFFSDSNQKRLTGGDQDIPIYEAKLTRDLRIIYQIDIAPDNTTQHDQQVLKVWGIRTHAQMDERLWTSISQHHGRLGQEYRRRCLYRKSPKQPGKNVILPESWSTTVEKVPVSLTENRLPNTDDQLELHSILALEKFTRMSQALLNSIITGQDTVYPFELTGPEQEICDHPLSCFVLGRSGTGKTTTMVFKMISREMLWIQTVAEATNNDLGPKYRQLFVTQSRVLAGHVQEYFSKMLMTQSAGHKTSQELERLAQRNQRATDAEDMQLMDEDDENERPDLPKKFSDLEDHHFPLFLTMDQLCKLLEGDCNLSFKRRPRTKEHRRAEQRSYSVEDDGHMAVFGDDDLSKDDDLVATSPLQHRMTANSSIITFDIFLYAYWPRFPQTLTKGLDPALVWNELLGVIKGSEETLDTANETNFLDKHTYLNFSLRRQSTFSKQREQVYQLFECYAKLKRERGDYDAADRTHAILHSLQDKISIGRRVDFLYVDEAQDNLIVDACLLRLLCSNPDGMFWAGDTAQTISMGSSFRFDDLKSFIYRFEKRSWSQAPVQPVQFQLAVNHRSHAGVVNCAQSVVELITKFWPESIDTLARERGIVDGPRPVFFCGWDPNVARYEQFLFHESGQIEFGAQQCILVRDDQARERLRHQIGEVGLVMTLFESKGLEFNDVLLFDFFHDSTPALAEWRMILNAVEEAKRSGVPAPRFDEARHSSLRSELKSLYVGITRARSHVWILDSSDKGEPMRVFWESKNLIQTCRPGDTVPELAVKSTPDQWAQQGRALFKTKHFQQAMFCFERAGLQVERAIAHAYLLRRVADRIALQQERGVSKSAAYTRAAEAFVVCAGLSASSRLRYLDLGAECFLAAGLHACAAQAYFGAEKYTEAAQQFKRVALFDEAVDVILSHPGKVKAAIAEQCINIAKLHYHREGQLKLAARLFDSVDDHLSYLTDFGFDTARADILEGMDRWADAAELHYQEGRYIVAIRLWLRASDPTSRRRAGGCLLDSLWRTLPLGVLPDDSSYQKQLLQLLQSLGAELPDQTQRNESSMFTAILSKNNSEVLRLAREFHRGPKGNPMAALLCFDHFLNKVPRMHNDGARVLSQWLEDYDSYAQLMRGVILDWQKVRAAKLLGLIEAVEESDAGVPAELHVLPTSMLYEPLKISDKAIQSADNYITVSPELLSDAIRQVLGQRIKQRLVEENETIIKARALRPCLNFVVTGSCQRGDCQREHMPRESLGVDAFNLRVRLHMQQILIVQNMDIVVNNGDHRKMQNLWRIWHERLYETLLPAYYALGHLAGLVPSTIPEHRRALVVLSDWTRDRFYSLAPYRRDRFLTDLIQTAMLAFTLDRANAEYYTLRADCVVLYRPPHLLRFGDIYIVHDLLDFLNASSETCISRGVLFLKHVLDRRLTIDIHTLLNLLEAVIGQAIIACRRSMHNLTLPRSWIVHLLSRWDNRCNVQSVWIVSVLFEPLKELLEAVYTNQGVDHLMYEGRPLSQFTTYVIGRNIIIFRICKCVTLFGYNIPHEGLRSDIGKTLTSINRLGRNFGPLISQYVQAGHWGDLARAVRASTESPLDEMVTLHRDDGSLNTYAPPRGVKLVRFLSESDLLTNLAYGVASKFNPEAKPFVPSINVQQAVAPDADVETFIDDTPDEAFNEEKDRIDVAPVDLSVQRTDEEVASAKVIQLWYRRQLTARSISKNGTNGVRSSFFVACQAQVDNLQVGPDYRRMFLGPMPHVLTALYSARKVLQETKRAMSKRLIGPAQLNLDEHHAFITKCSDLFKKHDRYWKELGPTSERHRKGDLVWLKQQVKEVKDILEEALDVAPSVREFMRDMRLGFKGIVQVASAPRPKLKNAKKPSLNTEDLDFF